MSWAKTRVEDSAARNELFAGAAQSQPAATPQDPQQMTVDQLVDRSCVVHSQTTQAALSAQRVAQETLQVQGEIMKELKSQDQQLDRMKGTMKEVNENVTYSEKLLRYMRRCCCCMVFDSCTGADPEEQRQKEWARKTKAANARGGDFAPPPVRDADSRPAKAASGSKGRPQPQAEFRNPNIQLTPEHLDTQLALQSETAQQNEALDQVHNSVLAIKDMAKAMQAQVEGSNVKIEGVTNQVDHETGRINDMNYKSQLAKYKAKVR